MRLNTPSQQCSLRPPRPHQARRRALTLWVVFLDQVADSIPPAQTPQPSFAQAAFTIYNFRLTLLLRICFGVWLARWAYPKGDEFHKYAQQIAESLSQPSIMFKVHQSLLSAPMAKPHHIISRSADDGINIFTGRN